MFQEAKFRKMKYLLQFPQEYDPEKAYPVLIFMHGAGTRGESLEGVKGNPFFALTKGHENFPFVVAAPLCSADTWFDVFETVMAFASFVSKRPYADKERIYLMGASMGGYAVWQMAMSKPELFAGIVPICGGGMYWNAARISHLPVWAFHGDSDPVVKTEESRKMVEQINAAGGNARLTVYENCEHDAWSQTYGSPEVFAWLLAQKRGSRQEGGGEFSGSAVYG